MVFLRTTQRQKAHMARHQSMGKANFERNAVALSCHWEAQAFCIIVKAGDVCEINKNNKRTMEHKCKQ